jgi:hypothetical protein
VSKHRTSALSAAPLQHAGAIARLGLAVEVVSEGAGARETDWNKAAAAALEAREAVEMLAA